jgi:membrane protease YdiL (CAAX protease family)
MTTAYSNPDLGDQRRPRSTTGRLLAFLVLAYGLSWWPWPISDLEANPDAALMVPVGPSIAALVMVLWLHGRPGGRALLRSLLHVRVGRWWLVLLLPVAIAGVAVAIAVVSGAPAPDGSEVLQAVVAALVTLPVLLVVGGPLGEELGWRGYVLPELLQRGGPIAATLILTPMWILFHLPWMLNEPDQYGPAWALAIVGMALTMTWVYLRTRGSLAVAVVFHAVINVSAAAAIQLFPEPDRPGAWSITAGLWLLTGLVAAWRMTGAQRSPGSLVARHPVAAFLVLALGIGWSVLGGAVVLDLPLEPFLLVANFGGLLGSAVLVTAVVAGQSGVRALLGAALRWRVGWPMGLAVLLAVPVATLAVAAVTGTARQPADGWVAMVAAYLVGTLVVGTLVFNLWEETAWAGFVQARLTGRHGLVKGAALTALPFAGIHLPLAFVDDPGAGEVAVNIAALAVVALGFRLLAGMILIATSGSVLAVAVVHASFNSAGSLPAVEGTWQSAVALMIVTAVGARVYRRRARRSTAHAEGASSALWAPPGTGHCADERNPTRKRPRQTADHR